MSWIRALAAAGLSLLFPGAGHVIVRDWGRALLFSSLFVLSLVLLLPVEQLWVVANEGSVGSVGAMTEMQAEAVAITEEETGMVEQFTLSFLALFAAIHASVQALGLTDAPGSGDDVPACPHCGKPLDEDLTFCHWCTTRLDGDDEGVSV